jgi:hypothetical protein
VRNHLIANRHAAPRMLRHRRAPHRHPIAREGGFSDVGGRHIEAFHI